MDAKNKWTSNQQLDLLQNAAVDDLNQPESSNTNKKKQLSEDNNLNGTGLRDNLHGAIYQLKLLMLFLQAALNEKYKFKLYSEEKDAEKFDDIIFQYGKNEQYRFLQAKHKLNPECSKITVSELSSEKSQRQFSLQKYFVSFCRIEKNERFRGKVKDFIICTNTDFSDDIKSERLIKAAETDDILDIGGGKRYKLIFDRNKDIVKKLKGISQRAPKDEQSSNDYIRDNDIKKFFEKLVFAVQQPDEQRLGEIVKERIFNSLDDLKDDVNAEVIYDHFLKQMLDWLKSRESITLSNMDDFFKKGEKK